MMHYLKRFWAFLKEDTWQSWAVSLILAFVIIKFMFFPLLAVIMGTPLPLVVVESCSMYHSVGFDSWWDQNGPWYEQKGISEADFDAFPFTGGLNKGDIIVVWGHGTYEKGDVIIFNSEFRYPLIHRLVTDDPLGTKGDNNFDQLQAEREIAQQAVVGKAIARVPGLGWLKLIFFEGAKEEDQRGFC